MIDIGSKIDRKYFLAYQSEAIASEARLTLWEKSIRIGATFAMAMRAVRRRMMGKGNLLHTSVNERIAKAFITDCKRFCRIYDVAGASDVREFEVFNASENRRETAYEIEFRPMGRDKDRAPASIKVFSSNPDAIRGEGGEVDIDEITSHRQPEAMAAAAGGRAIWGFPLTVWSSHKGVDSWFNRTIQEERAKGAASRWRIQRTTIHDALAAGLLEKIVAVSGQKMTVEDFLADTVAMVGGQEAFEEECECKPRAQGNRAVKWQHIDAAKTEYAFARRDIEGDAPFDAADWLGPMLPELRAARKVAIGYDVARTGHLAAAVVNVLRENTWRLAALLTMHKRKFGLQREAIAAVMSALPSAVGAGDATGLGMQVCEELVEMFGPGRFVGVNFGASKAEIGTKLTRVFEDGRQQIPASREEEDIAFDLAGIQSAALPSGRTAFTETANPVNKASHCDMAWAIGLSLFVGDDESQDQQVFVARGRWGRW